MPVPSSSTSIEEAIQRRDFDAVAAAGNIAIVPLLRTWRTRDRILGPWAYQAIKRLGERAETPLIHALHDADPFIRRDAARFLTYNGGQRAVEPLIRALSDQDGILRVNAAIALGHIGDERALEPLLRVLHDRNKNVAHHGGQAIGGIRYRHPAAILAVARDTTRDERTRSHIFRILGGRTIDVTLYEERLDTLIAALDDRNESPAIRRGAAAGLGQFRHDRVIGPLIAALRDDDSSVRASAARALGEYARYTKGEVNRRPVEPLIQMLAADDDPRARWMAALALQFFHDDRALPLLLPLRHIKAASIDEKRIKEAAGFVVRNMRRVARRRVAEMNATQRDANVP